MSEIASGHSLHLFNALEEEEQQTKRALGIGSFHATMLSPYLLVEAGMRPYSLYPVLFQLDISISINLFPFLCMS